ncbi:nitric oxide reductase transcriptional regulator NorR [Corticibacter populi]|nr:nitric oxide reductase transcriptional regulator NorR [Corticibacter populi]RZS30843.1 anaerobic nitric oxide reductase transcription regulator [Corticibacter populi]
MNTLLQSLLDDLIGELPAAVRLQRLVDALQAHFRCGAVALLKLEQDHLRPVAVAGLVGDALGRRFAAGEHPRLAAILARRGTTCFHHDSLLPDPYDGLIEGHAGEPLAVHDCMGIALQVDGEAWGALTLDALQIGTFDAAAQTALEHLARVVEVAVRVGRLEGEARALRGTTAAPAGPADGAHDSAEILGQSPLVTELLHELAVVADAELPVLLLGETGVGKELFAHRLHQLSRHRDKPLVHVNCAALPESLAESELFGHARGAFSGATSARPGRFEAANGGTLFLDEVGELPLVVQAKLLRTLQSGEIQRLGEDRPRRVRVRIIAATNRNLREQVRSGLFRADLYHRLSVYPVPIPPLRERGRDILLLAGRFLELNRARLGLRSLRLSPQAEQALLAYPWPGNVRELEHVISRAALKALSRGARRTDIVSLQAEWMDLEPGLAAPQGGHHAAPDHHGAGPSPAPSPLTAPIVPLRQGVAACQRQAITAALAASGGNWAEAARSLQLDASNLHKLARRLGLKTA